MGGIKDYEEEKTCFHKRPWRSAVLVSFFLCPSNSRLILHGTNILLFHLSFPRWNIGQFKLKFKSFINMNSFTYFFPSSLSRNLMWHSWLFLVRNLVHLMWKLNVEFFWYFWGGIWFISYWNLTWNLSAFSGMNLHCSSFLKGNLHRGLVLWGWYIHHSGRNYCSTLTEIENQFWEEFRSMGSKF